MNKKRLFILTALVLVVCLTLSLFAACDNNESTTGNVTETDLLFSNGTFKLTSDTAVLSSPNNWTGAPGSTSSTNGSPNDEDDLTTGVVNSSSSAWKNLRKEYKSITIASPGRGETSGTNENLDDNSILMIHNMTATAYKYTSSSHTLNKNSYYKLSVDVKTLLDEDNTDDLAGAYIYVNGSAYAGWEAIDTNGEWVTYTLYIEGSELTDGSITVMLALGVGNTETGHMTKGYAFFDNVYLQNLSDVDEEDENAKEFTEKDFDDVAVTSTVAKYSMKTVDAEFDYASSTTSVPYTSSKYSSVAGFGSGSNASTSSTYISKGILDTTSIADNKTSLSALESLLTAQGSSLDALKVPENSVGTRMLFMQNKQATAFGMRPSTGMNFAANTYYKLSVWANTFLTSGSASIRLTNGTNDDSNNYTIDDVSTSGTWTQYTFYVAANQFRSSELYLEFWLGYGGANDTDTHAVGAAFFDHITLDEISESDYTSAAESATAKKINMLSDEENMTSVDLSNFGVLNSEEAIEGRSTYQVIDTQNFTAGEFFKTNPGKPVEFDSEIFNSKVLAINNYLPSAFTLSTLYYNGTTTTKNTISIAPNKVYSISMFVKTENIASSTGITIEFLKYNKEFDQSKDKFSSAYTSLTSFTSVNTETLEDYKGYNDYTMFSFYVVGEEIEESEVAVAISLGTGNGSDYSKLLSGYAYISSLYVEEISYAEYASVTTQTNIKTYSMVSTSSESELSSNGYFKYVDLSGTENLYGEDAFGADGMLNGYLGVPSGWSVNNSTVLTDSSYKNMAGILNLNNASQLAALGINSDSFYNGAEGVFNLEDDSTVLAIKKDDTIATLGYTSNSVSLSAKSYYVFSIWAKATAGSPFSIILKTATADENSKLATLVGDGEWHMYTVFVETGISSTSVTLSLNAGYESGAMTSSTVFFKAATYASIDEKAFDNAQSSALENVLAQSWLVDSFDDVKDAEDLASPNNFTGALVDSDASSDEDTLASGVIDKTTTDFSKIDLDPDNEADEAIINSIFNDSETLVGDKALVIYNKNNTAYGYTSNSATLEAGKYYKISIWLLTYKLAVNADAEDLDEAFLPTATITLKANNKTYQFGKKLTSSSEDTDKQRIVNTSTYDEQGNETIGKWTEYSFYIFAEEDIEDTTATLTVSLGFDGEDYNLSGYVFVDNFSVEEIEESEFIARQEVYVEDAEGNYYKDGDNYIEITDGVSAPEDATLYKKLNDSEVADYDNSLNSVLLDSAKVKNNFRIVFTSDDSTEEPKEEEPPTEEPEKDPLVWLYVVSGVVSGAIVIIIVIILIKKFAPKRKKKLVKSGKKPVVAPKKGDKRDQFGK